MMKHTLACIVVMALISCGDSGEIPKSVFSKFHSLNNSEFCDIRPDIIYIDSEDGVNSWKYDPNQSNGESIEGYEITDSRIVGNGREVIELLEKADVSNDIQISDCFNPRHAIRNPKDKSEYMLICWECMHLRWSSNGEKGIALIDKSYEEAFISTFGSKTLAFRRSL